MNFNRAWTAKNPGQGDAKKVLCVCSAGLLRSATAANVLHKEFGYNTRAVGITDYALIPVERVLVGWADEIVVMEPWMVEEFNEFDNCPPIKCLRIPDDYAWNDAELVQMIKRQYSTC